MENKTETRKKKMKIRGLMCQSTATMVGCITDDPLRSVVNTRKPCISRNIDMDESSRTRLITGAGDKSGVTGLKPPPPLPIPTAPPLYSSSNNVFQVVVMRVSIHCQGCAGKIKKHLSKMEGVKWFSIDLETKMVTVQGNVSPIQLLESVSKIKRAEFWQL